MLSQKPTPPILGPTSTAIGAETETDPNLQSQSDDVEDLSRLGLVSETQTNESDELARQSLTTEQPSDNPSSRIL